MGYRADFSLESLKEIDRFFDEHSCGDARATDEALREIAKSKLFALGAYVGEVIRRIYQIYGAEWKADEGDSDSAVHIRIRLANGTEIWPVERVVKRFLNGPLDGIYGYGSAVRDYADSESAICRRVMQLKEESHGRGPGY